MNEKINFNIIFEFLNHQTKYFIKEKFLHNSQGDVEKKSSTLLKN